MKSEIEAIRKFLLSISLDINIGRTDYDQAAASFAELIWSEISGHSQSDHHILDFILKTPKTEPEIRVLKYLTDYINYYVDQAYPNNTIKIKI